MKIPPAAIEADQILLALQQLATNLNSANFNNNINRISKLPNSLTTTMRQWPPFDWKSETYELFECLIQTNLEIHNQLTEENKINYFHYLLRGDGLQTFKKHYQPQQREFERNLDCVPYKIRETSVHGYGKTQNFNDWSSNSANQKLIEFLDELQKLAKDACGVSAPAIIEQLIYAKMPPHVRKSVNQAHLENGTCETDCVAS